MYLDSRIKGSTLYKRLMKGLFTFRQEQKNNVY